MSPPDCPSAARESANNKELEFEAGEDDEEEDKEEEDAVDDDE